MGLTISDSGGGDFTPAPAGNHVARCISIIDLGTHHNEMYNTDRTQVFIQWELPNETIEIDGEEKPFTIGTFYTASLSEKANLRKDLESWRGEAFTADQLAGFNIEKLAGVPCLLNVTHKKKQNGSTRAVVSSVTPLLKDMECPPQHHETTLFDLSNATDADLETLSKGIRAIVEKSFEWQARSNQGEAYSQKDDPPGGDFEDDIPFMRYMDGCI